MSDIASALARIREIEYWPTTTPDGKLLGGSSILESAKRMVDKDLGLL